MKKNRMTPPVTSISGRSTRKRMTTKGKFSG
jgi:hypothetical protein